MRLSWTARFRIRRCVAGGTLPCGCSVGAYEMRDGATVWVVDEQDAGCPSAGHRKHSVLDDRQLTDEQTVWARLRESPG